ncbi:MAG: radical SAM protein, partial [Sulfurovum sp.]|nr:radical SAM protein [Sulfurovum sp.]
MKIDDVVDVVIIPFYECYPASCRFCNLKMKPLGKFGFLNTPIESFRQHIEPSDVERVAEWNAQNYIILGGEPTLSKYLIDLIDVIREKSNGKIILYTNGFLLGKYMKAKGFDDRVRYLIYSIDRLVLSMEGSKQYNDAIRGKGFTDLSHYIIDKLSEYIDVSVRMGFHGRNMKYIIEEMEYLNVPVLLFPRLDRLPIRRAYEFYHFV